MDRRIARPFGRSQLFHDHHPLRRADGEVHSVTLDSADSNLYAFRNEQIQQLAPTHHSMAIRIQNATPKILFLAKRESIGGEQYSSANVENQPKSPSLILIKGIFHIALPTQQFEH
ncbi:hypothetical protein [Pseudomonas sp. BN415]|uniref:hypothetical protein n=1 Tax=Pseudomonas sp. BN415 TaxID=2567889 RepID=UPI002454A344|nr:hypothetical protein [Pseudomonas sp. BN415]